ncbi:MAG: hypothetical protein LBC04_00235 [Holosporaceae bacterium]|jgi:hypothetical protein|nr:hypothetical protein [Holosporaceae bacterium]
MKVDFKNINSTNLKVGSIFYLYGNYKKTFEVFRSFVLEEFQKKILTVNARLCSVPECLKILNGQCDLFGGEVSCFCMKNVEDSHLEKVSAFFDKENSIFILESGNYHKSKKITDFFLNSSALAVASFNNELTFRSLTRMYFPHISPTVCDEIVKIIAHTDEELYSIFKKLSLLLDDDNFKDLKDYSVYKQSFLNGLDSIPLIRLLLQTIIKEKTTKSANFFKVNATNEEAIYNLLNAELMQKFGIEIGRGYIYGQITA